ncbi:hypothetical protein [Pseudomonas azerbaijanorientalis]|uniref:hypothetical protein n=1 Tax=Pseudomonas azerbaijanorientalis TaxID=2842350 RepID=UPI001C3C3583|nr:hypothetical protein [Pseudomonas azerbaijanorientalis]QXH64123.1 hypothetical protein KSS91_11855 [Pseudomonas azerbaijanorientalis]
MNMRVMYICVALFLGLAGCTTPSNTTSKTKDMVTVDIINRSSKDKLSAVYFEESYDCFNIKPIATNSTQKNITLTLEKKPYQTISFQYLGSAFDGVNFYPRSCNATYTFRADESDAYTVILENVYNNCDFEVRRDVLDASVFLIQKVKLNSRQVKQTKPHFENGPWCEAVEAFKS